MQIHLGYTKDMAPTCHVCLLILSIPTVIEYALSKLTKLIHEGINGWMDLQGCVTEFCGIELINFHKSSI